MGRDCLENSLGWAQEGEKGTSPIIRHSWPQKLDLSPFLPRGTVPGGNAGKRMYVAGDQPGAHVVACRVIQRQTVNEAFAMVCQSMKRGHH